MCVLYIYIHMWARNKCISKNYMCIYSLSYRCGAKQYGIAFNYILHVYIRPYCSIL